MKRIAQALGIAALAIAAAACSGGAAPATGAPSQPAASPSGDEIVVVAKDLKFDVATIEVEADTPTAIILDNQENVPHNIAVKNGAGETIFQGEIVSAKKAADILPPLPAGTYTFWCELHPDMQGTIDAS